MEEQRSRKTPWIIGAVVIAAVAVVVVYALTMNRSQMDRATEEASVVPKPSEMSREPRLSEDEAQKNDEGATIVFTDDGFTPKDYTVRANQTVKVKNDSSMQLQFSSDDHPTHTQQSELNLSVLQPGEEASFTPTRVGNWGFHDHINDQYTGSLTVTE